MNLIIILNNLLRITGIVALGLITIQIYLGATNKIPKIHRLLGILTYLFVFLHPFLLLLIRYKLFGRFDPYYVYVDVCVLCGKPYEHFINLGRIAFYLVSASVLGIFFKNFSKWLSKNHYKLHLVNFLAFYFVSFHSIFLGYDSREKWFLILFAICQIIVIYSLILKLKTLDLVAKLKNKSD